MKEITVSIIGAGASGLISLHRIVETFSRNVTEDVGLRIYLFDRSGVFGTGVAYSTPLPSHLLNVRAAGMSAVSSAPLHFVKWLQAEAPGIQAEYPGIAISENTFAPRKLYGRYLGALFHETVDTSKKCNIRIEFIKNEVVRATVGSDGIELILENETSLPSQFLILALGNFPSTLYQQFNGTPGYFPYPWPARRLLDDISPDKPVCVLGAGLSAVDTLFTLLANGHREKIYFVSRKGLLPKVQCPFEDYTPRIVTAEAIDRLTDGGREKTDLDSIGKLFMAEIEAAEDGKIDWLTFLNPRGDVSSVLEQDIEVARNGAIPWQTALMATRPLHPRIWNSLRPEEQSRFDRDFKTFWNHYRVPMSLVNAEKVLNLLHSGQLSVLGGIKNIHRLDESDEFRLTIETRLGPVFHISVPYLINATGQGLDVSRFQDRFLETLLKTGVVTPHASGGIQVDFDTCAVVHGDGRISNSVFALGELTRGVHFFTNAVSENARYADLIAKRIVDTIVMG